MSDDLERKRDERVERSTRGSNPQCPRCGDLMRKRIQTLKRPAHG
jgi:tRNA(Ile2) C34 agmatinyltransferase TiaS